MKKFLIIVILLICTVPEARADWVWGEEREKGPTFGFEIGAGMHAAAHEMRTATASESGKEGYIYGLGGQISITRRFFISLGAEYCPLCEIRMWGWDPFLGEYKQEEGISFWPLNVGFGYYPPLYLGRRLRIFLSGGAIHNIGHYYIKGSYYGGMLSRWKYNLGAYFGGGIEYFVLRNASLGLRYRHSLGKILDLGYSGYRINIDPNSASGQILFTSYFGKTPEMKKQTRRAKKEKIAKEMELSQEEKIEIMRKHYEKATDYYKKGKYQKAIEEWKKVLEIDPNHRNSKICIEKAGRKLRKE